MTHPWTYSNRVMNRCFRTGKNMSFSREAVLYSFPDLCKMCESKPVYPKENVIYGIR